MQNKQKDTRTVEEKYIQAQSMVMLTVMMIDAEKLGLSEARQMLRDVLHQTGEIGLAKECFDAAVDRFSRSVGVRPELAQNIVGGWLKEFCEKDTAEQLDEQDNLERN